MDNETNAFYILALRCALPFQTVENILIFEDIWKGFHNLLLLSTPEAKFLTFLGVNLIMSHLENAMLYYPLLNCVVLIICYIKKGARRLASPHPNYQVVKAWVPLAVLTLSCIR